MKNETRKHITLIGILSGLGDFIWNLFFLAARRGESAKRLSDMKEYTVSLRHFDHIALLFNTGSGSVVSIMGHTNKKEALC